MAAIRWEELDTKTYESVASVLLCLAYPDMQRIDGAGGDGGRDLQRHDEVGLHAFELKSFTGRLGAERGRRPQVERSLARAADLHPVSWTLVVPIDPTPGELKWFDHLRSMYSFNLNWRGRSWLDQQAARHPEVERYFLEGGEAKALRLLRELREEEAAVTDVTTAVRRLRRLASKINELDPFYTFNISVSEGRTAIGVRARFKAAMQLRPITGTLQFSFPNTKRGREVADRVAETLRYGTPVEVPSEYVPLVQLEAPAGLGGRFNDVEVSIAPIEEQIALTGRLLVVDPAGSVVAGLHLRFERRHAGTQGGVLKGIGPYGIVTIEIRLDLVDRMAEVAFRFSLPRSFYPSEVLPVLEFLDAVREPNAIAVELDGRRMDTATPAAQLPEVGINEEYVRLIRSLAFVQLETAIHFPIPIELSATDVEAIRHAEHLLRGESVEYHWEEASMVLTVSNSSAYGDWIASGEARAALLEADHGVHIAGTEVPLGRVRVEFPAVIAAPGLTADPGGGAELVFRRATDEPARMTLISRPETATPSGEQRTIRGPGGR